MSQPSDIEIAQQAVVEPITAIGDRLGMPQEALLQYGPTKAKIDYGYLQSLKDRPDGKLILVTAISPTPAGEGKTTTTVGLGDGLRKIGKKAMVCLREPSLGPCFGMKGGAAGGGYAQVVPMEEINLHFTGDFHAIGVAHNLLSAMIDNHIYWGNELAIDVRRISYRRVVDMNDRALRDIASSLGGPGNGFPRQSGFDITVASEIMAIFCLATDLKDLQRRIGNIVIGTTRDLEPITCKQIGADGAMTALLKDALMPNLVQTLEGTPAFIHGGPFANIAHGCNSVMATTAGLKMADYVVTEAGFGADLGAEKFLDIKCRKTGLKPDVVTIVATVRALKMHGGVAKADLAGENVDAVKKGFVNLERHLQNIAKYNLPAVVAINKFTLDTEGEIAAIRSGCEAMGVKVIECSHWADGGEGTRELATEVVNIIESGENNFKYLYEDSMSLYEKVETIAKEIYRADSISCDAKVMKQFEQYQERYGSFPVCMAKTQYSFSTDPTSIGAPTGHTVPVRELRLSAGAEFIVAICGDIMTMPGLPRKPAAESILVNDEGQIEGLF